MSAEYTPTIEEVRERWMEFDGGPDPDDAAEFDRWLRKVRERAWDEGFEYGIVRADPGPGAQLIDATVRNPYREDNS